MSQCSRCGAGLAPNALGCSSCGQATPLGVERARWQEHAAEQARMGAMSAWYRARAEQATTAVGAGRTSLALGIVSSFLFCIPLGVVPVLLGARSRKLARQAGMDVPASAWAGLIFGILSLLGFVGLWTAVFVSIHEDTLANDDRIRELQRSVAAHAADRVLGHETACQLAELSVRKDGFHGDHSSTPKTFDCEGKLTLQGEHAMLEDFRFHGSDDVTAAVCFKYGAQWYVDDFRNDPSCLGDAADAGAVAAPDAGAPSRPPPKPAPATHPSTRPR